MPDDDAIARAEALCRRIGYEPPGRRELEEIARAIECLQAAGERYRAESKRSWASLATCCAKVERY
jgi:hypothetical protein